MRFSMARSWVVNASSMRLVPRREDCPKSRHWRDLAGRIELDNGNDFKRLRHNRARLAVCVLRRANVAPSSRGGRAAGTRRVTMSQNKTSTEEKVRIAR